MGAKLLTDATKKRLKDALDEIKDLVEEVKEIEEKVELCEAILEEIDEIKEILSSRDEDELKAFRLLIAFIEKMKGLGGKVPLLGTFLELYIAALKTALWLIDDIIKKHSVVHVICRLYCEERAKHEKNLRETNDTDDEDEIARAGHNAGMSGVGPGEWGKYEDKFKAQYEDYKKELAMNKWLATAKEAKKKLDDQPEPEDEGEDGGGEPGEDPLKGLATLDAILGVGQYLARRIREIRERLKNGDLSPEERKQLEEELAYLENILSSVFGR